MLLASTIELNGFHPKRGVTIENVYNDKFLFKDVSISDWRYDFLDPFCQDDGFSRQNFFRKLHTLALLGSVKDRTHRHISSNGARLKSNFRTLSAYSLLKEKYLVNVPNMDTGRCKSYGRNHEASQKSNRVPVLSLYLSFRRGRQLL